MEELKGGPNWWLKMWCALHSSSLIPLTTHDPNSGWQVHQKPHPGVKTSTVSSLYWLCCYFALYTFLLLLLLLLSHFSRVWLCATPETAAHQAPPSLGFSRQEHWSVLPFPSPMHESAWKWKGKVKSLSRVRLLVTPWSGVPLPYPTDGMVTIINNIVSYIYWILEIC